MYIQREKTGPITDYPDRLVYNQFLPVFFNYGVIDIETTGLKPGRDEVIGFGWVFKNHVYGVARKTMSEARLKGIIKRIVLRALRHGYRVYAWNKGFEETFLGLKGLSELQLHDFEKKDHSLSWGIELPTNGSDVPRLWLKREYKPILLRGVYDALIEASSLPRIYLYSSLNHIGKKVLENKFSIDKSI